MNTRTILVIEDDRLNMKLVKTLLEQCSYAVLQAENAEDGIRLARSYIVPICRGPKWRNPALRDSKDFRAAVSS